MMDIDSPSNNNKTITSLKESPTFTATLRSNTLGLGLSHNLKRPLIHKKSLIYSNISMTNTDLSFSYSNKENIFSNSNSKGSNNINNINNNNNNSNNINNNNTNANPNSNSNALYKSFTFSGSPSLSRNSSVKKQMKKKSSSNLLRTTQSHNYSHNHSHNHNHNHNRSHSHSQSNHNNNNSLTHKHTKSNSSISSNSIFKNLSAKPSLDSIFNFTHDTQSNNLNSNKTIFSQANTNFIISPNSNISNISNFSTPNLSENDSYYSSDDNLSDSNELNNSDIHHNDNDNSNSKNNNNHANDTIDINGNSTVDLEEEILANQSFDNGESDNDNLDFGSPLQKKQSNKNKLFSNIKHFKLHRHQSLVQFGENDHNKNNHLHQQNHLNNPNLKFDTDQLTSNINGLSVNSDDDELIYGNSVLQDAPFKFSSNEFGKIPRITVNEFKKIFHEYKNKGDGKFCKFFDNLLIVDCRFKFEFKGGHIDGAVNISSFTELENTFFNDSVLEKTPVEFTQNERTLLIFHCEFSSHRGPMKADQLRYFDRSICGDFYPNLYYPDIVVLEGGYKDYYESEKSLHKSLSYIEMDNPLFKDERERNLTLLRRESSLSRKSSRNSSCVSLSRKTSHNSIKSINSSSILDFSSMNKVEINQNLKNRPSKRFLNTNNNTNITHSLLNNIDCTITNEQSDDVFTPSSLSSNGNLNNTEDGIFGGFGNHKIDLDHFVDEEDDDDYNDSVSEAIQNLDDSGIDNIKNSLRISRLPCTSNITTTANNNNNNNTNNDVFKIPFPRPRVNRRGSLHLRSNTVSSFTFSNPPGFKSVPLLSTPEKTEAKFGNNLFYQHNDSSVYSVQEDDENDDTEYKSIYYNYKPNEIHCDTPIKGRK